MSKNPLAARSLELASGHVRDRLPSDLTRLYIPKNEVRYFVIYSFCDVDLLRCEEAR